MILVKHKKKMEIDINLKNNKMKKKHLIKLILMNFLILSIIGCDQNREIGYVISDEEKWIREFFPKTNMIKVEGRYRDTIPIGIERAYLPNGLLRYEVKHNEFGELNGIVRNYYYSHTNNNFLKHEGQFYNGQCIGKWKFQRPDGSLCLIMDLDSFSNVTYYARFDEKGHFLKDSIGIFSCDTSKLW